ncbi:MAG: Glyceraldehyde-3-phosphate dehydrogenase [Tenericutes bacterium ADurb.BinA155]|jgi:glyceraldehyde 3-phosphate dehydrogenase|nr:MAG: Glyceraldehyde-3-phosphate dehydrogenase [Tenericutes bacterium ADurb.BinA155]
MSIKLAINGFGRIGRLAFRRAYEVGGFEVVAINDLVDAGTLAYLLKYDTTHRGWEQNEISSIVKKDEAGNITENFLVYKGKKIPVLGKKDPHDLKWGEYKVDIVLECTGRLKTRADGQVHLDNGAKGVIISAPSSDKDIPTFVYGVNTNKLVPEMKIISGGSCTTNCLAPVMKVLLEKYGVKGGFMTTVHAYTNDQTTLDLAKGDYRRGRAAAANIVPTTTGAAKAINLVIPELKGKLMGGAIRVPVIDGSLVDLSLILEKPVADAAEVNAAMKAASEKELKAVLGYTEDQIVSSDILGRTEGSIFDATQTVIFTDPTGIQHVKVVSWYDNEYSFTCQYVRLAGEYGKVLGCK